MQLNSPPLSWGFETANPHRSGIGVLVDRTQNALGYAGFLIYEETVEPWISFYAEEAGGSAVSADRVPSIDDSHLKKKEGALNHRMCLGELARAVPTDTEDRLEGYRGWRSYAAAEPIVEDARGIVNLGAGWP